MASENPDYVASLPPIPPGGVVDDGTMFNGSAQAGAQRAASSTNNVELLEQALNAPDQKPPAPQVSAEPALPPPQLGAENGFEGPAKLPPPQDDAHNPFMQPEPTVLGEAWKGVKHAPIGLEKGFGGALDYAGKAFQSGGFQRLGQFLLSDATSREDLTNTPDASAGFIKGAAGGMGEGLHQLAMTTGAGALIGGAMAGPPGAVVGGLVGTAAALPAFFGMAAHEGYQLNYDAAIKAGKTPDEANDIGLKAGGADGTIMAGAQALLSALPLGKLASPVLEAAGGAVKGALVESMLSTSWRKLGTQVVTHAGEMGGVMAGQDAAIQGVDIAYGGRDSFDPAQTAQAGATGLGMGLVTGSMGAARHAQHANKTADLLADPSADQNARGQAAFGIAAVLKTRDPELAKNFLQYSGMQILNGKPVEIMPDKAYARAAFDAVMPKSDVPLLPAPAMSSAPNVSGVVDIVDPNKSLDDSIASAEDLVNTGMKGTQDQIAAANASLDTARAAYAAEAEQAKAAMDQEAAQAQQQGEGAPAAPVEGAPVAPVEGAQAAPVDAVQGEGAPLGQAATVAPATPVETAPPSPTAQADAARTGAIMQNNPRNVRTSQLATIAEHHSDPDVRAQAADLLNQRKNGQAFGSPDAKGRVVSWLADQENGQTVTRVTRQMPDGSFEKTSAYADGTSKVEQVPAAEYSTPRAEPDAQGALDMAGKPAEAVAGEPAGETLAEPAVETPKIPVAPELQDLKSAMDREAQAKGQAAGPNIALVDPATLPDKPTAANNGIKGATTLSKARYGMVKKLGELFGQKVVLFRHADGDASAANLHDGAVLSHDGKTIYLNADASGADHMVIVGHEIAHQMKKNAPALYRQLRDALATQFKGGTARSFYRYYNAIEAGQGQRFTPKKGEVSKEPGRSDGSINIALKRRAEREKMLDEFIADLVGNRTGESRTWTKMFRELGGNANANKGLVYRIADFITSFIDRLMEHAPFRKFATDGLVRDLKSVRENVRFALKEFAQRSNSSPMSHEADQMRARVENKRARADKAEGFNGTKEPMEQYLVSDKGVPFVMRRAFRGKYEMFIGDQKIGSVSYHSTPMGEWKASGVEVDPKYRRQGIASAAYDFLEKKVINDKFTQLGGQSEDGRAFRAGRDQNKADTEAFNRSNAAKDRDARESQVDPAKDDLRTAIAKLGGLNKADVKSQWGSEEDAQHGRRWLVSPNGLSIEAMSQKLHELGYLHDTENLHNELATKFESGKSHYTPEGEENQARLAWEDHQESEKERAAIQAEGKTPVDETPEDDSIPFSKKRGDIQASPVRGYHGTQADVRNPRDLERSLDLGPHFSTDRNTAELFAKDQGRNGRILDADLHFQKSLELPDQHGWFPTKVAEAIDQAHGVTEKNADGQSPLMRHVWDKMQAASRATHESGTDAEHRAISKWYKDRTPEEEALARGFSNRTMDASQRAGYDALKAHLKSHGYDSIKYTNESEGKPADTYIALDKSRVTRLGEAPEIQASTRRAQVNSPQFKQWFGDSKVVNEDGTPKVMYHGSGVDLSKIISNAERRGNDYRDPNKPWNEPNKGIFFTADPGHADFYAKGGSPVDGVRLPGEEHNPAIYPVYLSIKNPKIIEQEKSPGFWDRIREKMHPELKKQREKQSADKVLWDELESFHVTDNTLKLYREQGYDGIINKLANEVVVFDPSQIKSAVGNSGGFDASRAEIAASKPRASADPEEAAGGGRVKMRGPGDKPGIYTGTGAAGVRESGLETAKEMLTQGLNPATVRAETGWFKSGVDGKWRREIDDSRARFKEPFDSLERYGIGSPISHKLGDVLDHPELYANYPEARDIRFRKMGTLNGNDQGGYLREENGIHITPYATDPRSSLLHEVQHWIQNREGFDSGANPDGARLDNPESLKKARSMLQREIDSLPEKDLWRSILKKRVPYIDELIQNAPKNRELYDRVESSEREIEVLKQEKDAIKAKHDAAWEAQRAQDNSEYDAKWSERSARIRELQDRVIGNSKATPEDRAALEEAYKEPVPAKPLRSFDHDALRAEQAHLGDQIAGLERHRDEAWDAIGSGSYGTSAYRGEIRHRLYQLVAGEREARDVQLRKDMDIYQRRDFEPYAAEGIPDEQTIRPSTRRSDEFNNWFGDSKVTDEEGNPKTVYHGTSRGGFDQFDAYGSNHGLFGQGVYTTESRDVAQSYTKKGRGSEPQVYPLHARIEHPIDMDARADRAAWEKGFPAVDFDSYAPHSDTNEGFYRAAEDHFIDEGLPKWEGAEAMQDGLRGMGHDGITHMGGGRVDAEGERHRVHIAFDPEQVKSATENSGEFNRDDASIYASKRRAQGLGELTKDQEAQLEKVGGIVVKSGIKDRIASKLDGMGLRLEQGLAHRYAAIRAISELGFKQARQARGSDGGLEALMQYGKLSVDKDGAYDTKIDEKNPYAKGFAAALAKLDGEHNRFFWWVAAHRAEELAKLGKENLFDPAAIKTLKGLDKPNASGTAADRPAKFKEALKAYNDFNDNVVSIAEKAGLLNAESRAMFKDHMYVPFFRVAEETGDIAGPRNVSGLVNQFAFHKLGGGTDKINSDLLANVLQNWSHLLGASARNRAARTTLDAAKGVGAAHKIPSGLAGKNSVKVMVNGEKEHWTVTNKPLYSAVSAMYAEVPGWMKPLSTFKHALTFGVTVMPGFKYRNVVRDTITTAGVSEASNPFKTLMTGWEGTNHGSQTRASMLASGAIIRFGNLAKEGSAQATHRLIRTMTDPKTVLDTDSKLKAVGDKLRQAFEAYQELGDRSENINRAGLYKQLRAKGFSHMDASFAARDLLDFSDGGTYPAVQFLVQSVPFMNARIQGLFKLGQAATDPKTRKRFLMTAGAVSLASLGLMLRYQNDPDFKRREDWERDNFWWFKFGGVGYSIPKPFEIGAIGTAAERLWEAADSNNHEMTAGRMGQRLLSLLGSQFSLNPTPQIVKPFIDVYANRDGFTNRPIESMAMQKLQPADRYDPRSTSAVARGLGKLSLPDPVQLVQGNYQRLSPVQYDALLKGYFGGLGQMIIDMADHAAKPSLGMPAARPWDLGNYTMGIAQSLPANRSSRYMTELYDQMRDVEQAHNSWRQAIATGDFAKARQELQDNRQLITQYSMLETAKRMESRFNLQEKRVANSSSLTADQKQARMQQLNEQRNKIAERMMSNVRRRSQQQQQQQQPQ